MLCCAIGIGAAASVPFWRKLLRTAGSDLSVRAMTVAVPGGLAIGIATILAAHAFMHRGDLATTMPGSRLCIAPSLATADFRLADRSPHGLRRHFF